MDSLLLGGIDMPAVVIELSADFQLSNWTPHTQRIMEDATRRGYSPRSHSAYFRVAQSR